MIKSLASLVLSASLIVPSVAVARSMYDPTVDSTGKASAKAKAPAKKASDNKKKAASAKKAPAKKLSPAAKKEAEKKAAAKRAADLKAKKAAAAKKPVPAGKKIGYYSKKAVPAAKKPAPAAKKPVPAAKKPAPTAKKPVPAAKKPVPAAKKLIEDQKKAKAAVEKVTQDEKKAAAAQQKLADDKVKAAAAKQKLADDKAKAAAAKQKLADDKAKAAAAKQKLADEKMKADAEAARLAAAAAAKAAADAETARLAAAAAAKAAADAEAARLAPLKAINAKAKAVLDAHMNDVNTPMDTVVKLQFISASPEQREAMIKGLENAISKFWNVPDDSNPQQRKENLIEAIKIAPLSESYRAHQIKLANQIRGDLYEYRVQIDLMEMILDDLKNGRVEPREYAYITDRDIRDHFSKLTAPQQAAGITNMENALNDAKMAENGSAEQKVVAVLNMFEAFPYPELYGAYMRYGLSQTALQNDKKVTNNLQKETYSKIIKDFEKEVNGLKYSPI